MKITDKSSKFNSLAIIFVSLFLFLYFNYGRNFLSWQNFVIFVVGSVCIFLITLRSKSSLISTTFAVALIPIIPHPLRGIPICCLLIFLCFSLYGFMPNFTNSKNLFFLVSVNLLVILIALFLSLSTNPLPGNIVFLSAWLSGILLIFMSIRVFPNLTTSRNLINSFWIGTSITCTLGLILYVFPGRKLPGISVSVNYGYLIGNQNYGRYSGVLGDYELYGQFCGIATLLCLYIGLTSIRFCTKIFGYATALISTQQLLLTGTRSSLIVCILFCTLLIGRFFRSNQRNFLDIILLSASFVLSVTYLQFAIIKSGSILRLSESVSNVSVAFNSDRGSLWQFFLGQIGDEFIKIPEYLQFPVASYGAMPHSLPITLIFMFGLIPFISFYTVALIPIFLLSWRGSLDEFILKLMLTQLLLESLKVEATRLPQYLTVFFTLIGLCYVRSVEKNDGSRIVPETL